MSKGLHVKADGTVTLGRGGYSLELLVGMFGSVLQTLTLFQTKISDFPVPFSDLGPVAQRPDNFIPWISQYPTVLLCEKISVFPRVQANMHTLTTV